MIDANDLIAVLPIGIAVWRARDDGRLELIAFNDKGRDILGPQLEVGKTYEECAGDYTGAYGAKLYEVAKGSLPGFSLGRFAHRGVEVLLKVERINDNLVTAIFEDASAFANLEDRLQQKIRELQRSNRELEQFAYVASHDLLEPVRMIGSFSELLELEYGAALMGDGKIYLQHVLYGAKRARELIDALLSLSRVGRHMNRGICPMSSAVNDALLVLRDCIAERHGEVRIEGPMPKVLADHAMMVSLFQNLIGNALKFRRDGVPPIVVVQSGETSTHYTFEVKDNGVGFDQAHANRIFSLFARLKTNKSGTGIGLAVCKKIVEYHGGTIKAVSVEGEGTTFTFTIEK